jgi:hypothetical protein
MTRKYITSRRHCGACFYDAAASRQALRNAEIEYARLRKHANSLDACILRERKAFASTLVATYERVDALLVENKRLQIGLIKSALPAIWQAVKRFRALLERASLQLSYYDKGQDYELSLVRSDISNELEID